jgi:hypothetical protein
METPHNDLENNLNQTDINKPEVQPSRKELKQLILQLTEEKLGERFSDTQLDRELEKIKLIGGAEITISGLKQFIRGQVQPHETRFTLEYFTQICRLNGWSEEEAKQFYKRPEVALYNRQIIYGRFPKEVIQVLETVNPYYRFAQRLFMHHQFLTPKGVEDLKLYIKQAIEMMKQCNNWHEFTAKYAKEYGLPFQMSIFDNN